MTRTVLFDVDGVLIHGYHSRPELQQRWDENLLKVMGVDPERFRNEFIYDVFDTKVIIGKMALIDALEGALPALGYKGSPMTFAHYWMSHESRINQPLLDIIRGLKAGGGARLFIATNQEHLRAIWLWQALSVPDLFEDIFYSARIGAMKPEKAFFDFVSRYIGETDEPHLFFDDTPKIVEAAQTHGWESVRYQELEDVTSHPWIAERLGAASSNPDDALDSVTG